MTSETEQGMITKPLHPNECLLGNVIVTVVISSRTIPFCCNWTYNTSLSHAKL